MLRSHLFRLLRFIGIGCISTAVYTAVFIALQETVKPSVFWSTVLAYCCAMVVSFLGQKHVTFRAKGNTRIQLIRYVLVYGLGLALAYSIMELCTHWYHLHYIVGVIAVDVALPLFSFVAMLVFVFADRGGNSSRGLEVERRALDAGQ